MPTLLHVDSSPRGPYSASRRMSAEFADTWKKANPAGRIVYRDLNASAIPPVDLPWIGAAYTPADNLSNDQKHLLSLSDELIAELQECDQYILGVPMFNFSIPAVLKLYIDQVARVGKTFSYSASGPKGLLEGKKAHAVVAYGGNYGEGTPYALMNFVEPYLKTIFGFMGVKEITFTSAVNAGQVTGGKITLDDFLVNPMAEVRAAVGA